MINNLSQKIKNAWALAPVLAAADPKKIGIKVPTGFENLDKISAQSLVSGLIAVLLIVVALVFFFILVLGGLKWVTSEGDEKKVGAARAQITNGLIGLAIVFAAFAIMKLIGSVFGVDIFNFDIPNMIGA